MKKYKIYSLLFILALSLSCTDQYREDALELAEDVTRMTTPGYLLSGSIVHIAKFYHKKGLNEDDFNAIMLYYQQLFSVKAQSHEEFAQAPSNWGTEYDLIYDAQAGINIALEDGLESTAAAQQILQSLMFGYLTDIYGDIPYSEALKGRDGLILPKFDIQEDVYSGLLATLDEAISTLGSSSDEIDPESDLLYGGDKQSWIKFANSLKIRMLVRSYDAFGGSKKAELQAAASASIIDDNSYNAVLAYEGTADNNSWVWGPAVDGSLDEMSRRKPSVPFLDLLQANNDPRLLTWIAPVLQPWGDGDDAYTLTDYYGNSYDISVLDTVGIDIAGFPIGETYVGAPLTVSSLEDIYNEDVGSGSYDNNKLSSYTSLFIENSHDLLKATLMEASEISFCLAEAAQRGWISGSASDYYETGIEQNMDRWAITDVDISTYVEANPLPAGNAEALTSILTEKWKSLFTQGHQSWFNYRRTGIPEVVSEDPAYVALPFPLRWRYPTYEVDNNTENVEEAVARLGEDTQTAEIWIMK